MKRREFLAASAAGGALMLAPRYGHAAAVFDPKPGPWRGFAVTTRLDIRKQAPGPVQAWVPLPSIDEPDWSAPEGDEWGGNAATSEVVVDPVYGARILHTTFAPDETEPRLEVVSRFRTRDRGDVLDGPASRELSEADRRLFLAATEFLPTDGIVLETAERITEGQTDQVAKARAIYEWVVENSRREAAVRGCGLGDVASMLAIADLSGKCADLNALFVALARASGLPARDLYGLRVAPSAFGYKSLGAGSEVVTKSQHCRAEVWIDAHGWAPVDPADVRKVMLEEPPGDNALGSEKVVAARAALFGAWEGNWMAYNDAHDVTLPGSTHRLAFLMYPQAEVAGMLLDCLSADTFAYVITAAETAA